MAYSALVNITDWKDLLAQIKTFATGAPGWTAVYDDIAANAQLGLSKGNCYLAIGAQLSGSFTNPQAKADPINGGTVDDSYLFMTVNQSLTGGNPNWYGHPGSLATAASHTDRAAVINDVDGAFANVWLFSSASGSYIWVVTQQGGDRFNIFGFGVLDDKGMTVPDVAFCVGSYYHWWPNASYINNTASFFNNPASTAHVIGMLANPSDGTLSGLQCFLKDATVDPALGFTDGDFQTTSFWNIANRGNSEAAHQLPNAGGDALDYFLTVDATETTGGIPLSSLGVRYKEDGYAVYLGDLPDIRLVMLGPLTVTQEIVYGGETWKVFPLKRKSGRETTHDGASPQPYVTSIDLGFAIKKIV